MSDSQQLKEDINISISKCSNDCETEEICNCCQLSSSNNMHNTNMNKRFGMCANVMNLACCREECTDNQIIGAEYFVTFNDGVSCFCEKTNDISEWNVPDVLCMAPPEMERCIRECKYNYDKELDGVGLISSVGSDPTRRQLAQAVNYIMSRTDNLIPPNQRNNYKIILKEILCQSIKNSKSSLLKARNLLLSDIISHCKGPRIHEDALSLIQKRGNSTTTKITSGLDKLPEEDDKLGNQHSAPERFSRPIANAIDPEETLQNRTSKKRSSSKRSSPASRELNGTKSRKSSPSAFETKLRIMRDKAIQVMRSPPPVTPVYQEPQQIDVDDLASKLNDMLNQRHQELIQEISDFKKQEQTVNEDFIKSVLECLEARGLGVEELEDVYDCFMQQLDLDDKGMPANEAKPFQKEIIRSQMEADFLNCFTAFIQCVANIIADAKDQDWRFNNALDILRQVVCHGFNSASSLNTKNDINLHLNSIKSMDPSFVNHIIGQLTAEVVRSQNASLERRRRQRKFRWKCGTDDWTADSHFDLPLDLSKTNLNGSNDLTCNKSNCLTNWIQIASQK
ncbi:hypothetical protein GJ496_001922 [Pomphorhynchus laevis]|nr:hypothetical protein GJ496_001922 [Pomphorhynchus laevis]